MRKMPQAKVVQQVDRHLQSNKNISKDEEAQLLSYKMAALVERSLFTVAFLSAEAILNEPMALPEAKKRMLIKRSEGNEILENFDKAAKNLEAAKKLINQDHSLKKKFYPTGW